MYIVGLYSLYYLSLLITVTQDPSCFLSHLNIRAKIVQNVFKEFFTFKDIQRLYRLRLLVAMAIGRHLLLLSLARSHRTRFVPVRLLCTQDWSWGPKRCVKPDHMCYVDHYVFLYIQFLKMEEKKKGKKNSWSLWDMSNPFAIALQNMSLGAFPPTSLMRLELAAN